MVSKPCGSEQSWESKAEILAENESKTAIYLMYSYITLNYRSIILIMFIEELAYIQFYK